MTTDKTSEFKDKIDVLAEFLNCPKDVINPDGIITVASAHMLMGIWENQLNINISQQTAALQQRVQELEAQLPKWIDCKERLPEWLTWVIVYDGKSVHTRVFSRTHEELGIDGFIKKTGVTHWQPLPEPPSLNEKP